MGLHWYSGPFRSLGDPIVKLARRNDDHLGTVLGAFPKACQRLERPLGLGLEHVGVYVRDPVGPHRHVPIPLLLDVRLIDPANQTSDDADQQHVNEGSHAPRPALATASALRHAARYSRSVGSRFAARSGRSRSRSAASNRPVACVSQAALLPFAAQSATRALDAFHNAEEPGIFRQPALQQAPLAQQRLVRRLDGCLAGVLGDIGGQQALLDEMLDQWPCLGGNLREPGDAPAWRAGVGVDAGEPGDQAAAEQRQPREAVLRDRSGPRRQP